MRSSEGVQTTEPCPEDDSTDAAAGLFDGSTNKAFAVIAVAASIFHIYANTVGIASEKWLIGLHFAGFALLCALLFPANRRSTHIRSRPTLVIDIMLGLVVAAATIFIINAEDMIYAQGVRLSTKHWIAAGIIIAGGIEMTRRTTGPLIPTVIIIALAYASPLGAWAPGAFKFAGLNIETIVFRSIFADEGMFGIVGRISATYVFMFILFGTFLVRSGAGDFIIALARLAAGRFQGGPAYVAVFASGLTGTISGSAIANAVSTGVVTIPLMKRSGFSPRFAGAVEAAASTGGQLMPPIMGAGAFIMASNTQIPYLDIIAVSALPAFVYFLSVAFFIRIEVKKHHIIATGNPGDTLASVLRRGGPAFLIPFILLVGLLVAGFTPVYAAGLAIVATIGASWLTPKPMGPRAVIEALILGAKNMIMTAILLITIGLMVNVIAMTGIGNVFSLMIAEWSGNSLIIALVLVALASLVLGMGLPVTAAYIVLATLSAPALQGLIQNNFLIDMLVSGQVPEAARATWGLLNATAAAGLTGPMPRDAAEALIAATPPDALALIYPMVLNPAMVTAALLSAHMIIFWLSQDSNVTPPVCLVAFAAAAIARAPHMATGFTAWRLAKGLYLMPVLFAYSKFLHGTPMEMAAIFFSAVIAVYGIGAALAGHMDAPLNLSLRLIAGGSGLAIIWPSSLAVDIIAAGVVLIVTGFNVYAARHQKA
jgi:TRAP transporter 4TM/12TM fusion protein